MISTASPEALRASLLDWYAATRRELPWRATDGETPDPYRVWVSEVMLQQTRVDAVRPYFERWVERFPDVASLAAAPLDDVLKAWEGLGYYSRARNLHRAAGIVAERFAGTVPDDLETFRSLPGVGRYTAGAVMSIAFGRSEPAVDGNVRRVLARLADEPDPSEKALWETARELVPSRGAGDFNQALMELGATVCTPRSPRCGSCPIARWCAAAAAGTQAAIPAPRRRGRLPHELTAVAVAERDGRFLIARKPTDARLGGLWEFPAAVCPAGESIPRAAERALRDGLGLDARAGDEIGAVEHVLTHVRITYRAIACATGADEPRPIGYDAFAWATGEELDAYPLPAAQKRIAALAAAAGHGRGVVSPAA